jgi:hypothetical protein
MPVAAQGFISTQQIGGVCQNSWAGIGGTSGWTDDNGVVRLTTISDNVGIGTAAPIGKLDVRGNSSLVGRVQLGGASTGWIDDVITGFSEPSVTNDAFLFVPGYTGVENSDLRLYMLDNNVERFSIWGDSCGGGSCGDINAADLKHYFSYEGMPLYDQNYLRSYGLYSAGDTIFDVPFGNVGIGTVTPGRKLDVNGFIRVLDTAGIDFGDSSTAVLGSSANDYVRISTNGSERFRVNSAGNVGIGTATPGYKLDVNGRGRFTAGPGSDGLRLEISSGSGNAPFLLWKPDVASNNYFWQRSDTVAHRFGYYNGASWNTLMSYESGGDVGIGTTDPQYKLEVNGDINTSANLREAGTTLIDKYLAYGGFTNNINSQGARYFYTPLIDNFLFSGSSRFSVTGVGFTSFSATPLFDGNYDQWDVNITEPSTSGTVTIDLVAKCPPAGTSCPEGIGSPTNGITYPQGYIYLSFYRDININRDAPSSVSGRMLDRDSIWRNLINPTAVGAGGFPGIIWRLEVPGFNWATRIELTINAPATNRVSLKEIDYFRPRRDSVQSSAVTKYSRPNRLYNTLEFVNSSNITNAYINTAGRVSGIEFCISGNCRTNWPSGSGGGDSDWLFSGGNMYASTTIINVGIGTNNPSEKLHVEGHIYAAEEIYSGEGAPFYDQVYLRTYGLQSAGDILLDAQLGGVGIGTDLPSSKVHIVNSTAQDSFRVDDSLGDITPFVIDQSGNFYMGGPDFAYFRTDKVCVANSWPCNQNRIEIGDVNYYAGTANNDGIFGLPNLHLAADNNMSFQIDWSQAAAVRYFQWYNGPADKLMELTEQGTLAIGGGSHIGQLTVESTGNTLVALNAPAGNSAGVGFYEAGAAKGGINFYGSDDRISILDALNNEALTLLSNGDIGIGSSSPSHGLTVTGGSNTMILSNDLGQNLKKYIRFNVGGAVGQSTITFYRHLYSVLYGGSDRTATLVFDPGTQGFGADPKVLRLSGASFDVEGNIKANTSIMAGADLWAVDQVYAGNTTSYVGSHVCWGPLTSMGGTVYNPIRTCSSDMRFKKNITTLDNALSKVLDLRGVKFQLKDTGLWDVGFIAQEVKEVLPEAVRENTDGYYTMTSGQLAPLLLEAIKEQQAQIEELRQEIELLKAR